MLVNYDTLEDDFAAHRTIRSLILAAKLPYISHERTTIKFIIRGFKTHQDFQYVLTSWASQPPAAIQDLMSFANSTQSMLHYISSATPIPTITTHVQNTLRTHHHYDPTTPIRTYNAFTNKTRSRLSPQDVHCQYDATAHGNPEARRLGLPPSRQPEGHSCGAELHALPDPKKHRRRSGMFKPAAVSQTTKRAPHPTPWKAKTTRRNTIRRNTRTSNTESHK